MPPFVFEIEAYFHKIFRPDDVIETAQESRGLHGMIGLRDGTRFTGLPLAVVEACDRWVESGGAVPTPSLEPRGL